MLEISVANPRGEILGSFIKNCEWCRGLLAR